MRAVKIMAAFILFLAITPIYSGWSDWEYTVLGCENYFYRIPAVGSVERYFQASADYTCFSNSEFANVPIIPERFGDPDDDDPSSEVPKTLKYRVNRLFYQGDDYQSEVEFLNINHIFSKPIPILATTRYYDDGEGTEYCIGLFVRYFIDSNLNWTIASNAVNIPDNPETEMTLIGDVDFLASGTGGPIVYADVAGDGFGYVHLVTAETSLNFFYPGRWPDWTTNLYYSRWNAQEQDWDIDHYPLPQIGVIDTIQRNPDVACDSQGNVHVVFTYNDNAASSDYGIGYYKIIFDQYGQVSTVTTEIVVQDGSGLMCESPDITVDDLNRPHVVFQRSGNSTDWRVYYTTKSGMGLWNAPTQVPPPQGTYYYYWEPSITYCHNYIHVVYAGAVPSDDETFTTSNNRIYYTRRSLTGQLFDSPVEMSGSNEYSLAYGEGFWEYTVFPCNYNNTPRGYANMNRFPCVIAGDDEISVIWVGNDFGYWGPAAILARRCSWVDE